ncbi:response regulator transcription factor [Acidipila sp. EB88]|uniref:response regulator transcription factor n=1 Tax=Acidipila sp. EB88 TaxID=2305226 RepID=UPI000F5E7D20|nr:response regulator [Acidipila sp. EB88]RRA49278.1 DNA-binding response regulator [Acidipila sp. EB88]
MLTPKADVFIVDDDVSVREALAAVLLDEGFAVETFDSAEEVLAGVRRLCPYSVVLDVNLPGLNGLELQGLLHVECPSLPIIFITGIGNIPMSVRAMKNGAAEFLAKPFSDRALLEAVRTAVETGKRSQVAVEDLKSLRLRYSHLTPRERAVFLLVVAGLANKNVGFELGISEITVKAHRGSVMRKLQADSLAALIQMAIKLSVLQDGPSSSAV